MVRNSVIVSISILSFSVLLASALNHQGISLLSWLSTFDSFSASSFFSSWNSSDNNPCSWRFIECGANGLVSEIHIKSIRLPAQFPTQILSFSSLATLVISGANITGEIPPAISNLTSLVLLDLRYNALTGNIPPELGKLSKLQYIYLNSNSLRGPTPPEISNCSELRGVELVDNQLWGAIPEELGRLSSLRVFRAGGNAGISGGIPWNISSCQKLIFFGLADTSVSGELPSGLGALKNLKTLSVYAANLSGAIPKEISNCSGLENLYLYQNRLFGELPEELGAMTKLKNMLLWNNMFSGSIPASLGNSTALQVIDFSLNSLAGEIPPSFSALTSLEVLLLSCNNISGEIPPFIGNISLLKQLELDNNQLSGEIPASIGSLSRLTQFFAWQNQLHGGLPSEIGGCRNLQSLDLSFNFLTRNTPSSLFSIASLSKLMLIGNGFSGDLPRDIGNCTGLTRLRLGSNRFSGKIPPEIGLLDSLTFLELSENKFSGEIPVEIGGCSRLEMLDLHENRLQGMIPSSLESLSQLNVLDLSSNRLSGPVPEAIGKLTYLNKLALNGNYITGSIPKSIASLKSLQSLDLSSNRISGLIPGDINRLQSLDIVLNLSWNSLSGTLPTGLSNLSKLGSLDLSHNMLTGSLTVLGALGNLVSLDVSFNDFSGDVPDTVFFRELPRTMFAGNQQLCFPESKCSSHRNQTSAGAATSRRRANSTRVVIFGLVLSIALTAVFAALGLLLAIRTRRMAAEKRESEEDGVWQWELTPFQKLEFTADEVMRGLAESNIIGKGSSGVVYRVETRNGLAVAVKEISPENNGQFSERDFFAAEVKVLGSVRHKNIVRLLGCCSKRGCSVRLLIFDYMSNGSLDRWLHDSKVLLDWDSRYRIALGAAQGVAYLHHDCNPPIIHRDIKANNILISNNFDAHLADFGLAKFIDPSESTRFNSIVAGSFGYIAPEYSYTLKITEKSDVYSYGIVLLEMLTGLRPTDERIPGGGHIVEWVRRELRGVDPDAVALLDECLRKQTDLLIQEMLQVLGVALLCVNPSPEDRPTMRDVAAMLKEIRLGCRSLPEDDESGKKIVHGDKETAACSSFSRSCEPLMSCSSSPI